MLTGVSSGRSKVPLIVAVDVVAALWTHHDGARGEHVSGEILRHCKKSF